MFTNTYLDELVQKYRENRLAHAYLIETNNLEKANQDILTLIKIINCEEEYQPTCQKCNLCNLINLANLPSIKVINPDGISIKKNQIEELKQDFNTMPIYSKYNVYIINNAEKLNPSSANALLKFLEEPTPGILGFFLTPNKDIIIDTIKSRCQILTLNYSTTLEEELNITTDQKEAYYQKINEFLKAIATNQNINIKTLILNDFPERLDILNIFQIILKLYYNYYLKLTNQIYDESLLNIYPLNENLALINQKMQITTKILTNMSYNVNIELILDKYVLEMRGIYEH